VGEVFHIFPGTKKTIKEKGDFIVDRRSLQIGESNGRFTSPVHNGLVKAALTQARIIYRGDFLTEVSSSCLKGVNGGENMTTGGKSEDCRGIARRERSGCPRFFESRARARKGRGDSFALAAISRCSMGLTSCRQSVWIRKGGASKAEAVRSCY